MQLDVLIAFTQASYCNMKSLYKYEHNKNK